MYGRKLILGVVATATMGAGVAVALTAHAATNTYEAEAAEATRAGGARIASCSACSGGKKVGYVGNNSGSLRFNGVTTGVAGPATVTIAYASGQTRSAQLTVNGGTEQTIAFPTTGGFSKPGTLSVTVTLNAGGNTLRFGNRNGWAPDFDKITVASASTPTPSPTTQSPGPTPPSPPTAPPPPPPSPSPTQAPSIPPGDAAAEAAVVVRVNEERVRAGCPPVAVDDRLAAAARAHSADMAARGYFSHTTPEGVDFSKRITNAGYIWSGLGENIAKGQRTPTAVMDAWMSSPGHKANILTCGFKHIGVGLAYDSSNTPVWTQDFASPR